MAGGTTRAQILCLLVGYVFLQQAFSQCNNLPNCTCEHSSVTCNNTLLETLLSEGQLPVGTTSLTLTSTTHNPAATRNPSPNHKTHFTTILRAANFSHLPHLVHLTLSSARITDLIGEPFLHVTRLQSLNLSHNAIERLSPGVFNGAHTHLRILDLSHNLFTNFNDPAIFFLPHLKYLNLGYNVLNEASLNGTFSQTHVLETLVLDGNKLASIRDPMFSHLDRLQTLSLTNCHISTVYIDFQDYLSNLVALHLEYNEVWETEAIQLRNPSGGLRFLYLDHNLMDQIPSGSFAGGGVNLHTLSLSSNNISTLAEDAFVHLPKLQELNLSQNELDSVQSGAFTSLGSSLRGLNLAFNGLQGEFNISELHLLRELNLSGNALSMLPEGIHRLVHLQRLDLSRNRLRTLTSQDFQLLQRLDYINLGNNSWFCDCGLYEFYRQWVEHSEPSQLCGLGPDTQNSKGNSINNFSSPVTSTRECIICSEPNVLASHSVATLAIDLQQCGGIDKSNLLGLYIMCGVILFIIFLLLVFMWIRRNSPIPGGSHSDSSSISTLLGRDRRSSWIWEILTHRKSHVIQNRAVPGCSELDTSPDDEIIQTVSGTTALHTNKNLQVYVEPSSEQIIISNPIAISDTLVPMTTEEDASPLHLTDTQSEGCDCHLNRTQSTDIEVLNRDTTHGLVRPGVPKSETIV